MGCFQINFVGIAKKQALTMKIDNVGVIDTRWKYLKCMESVMILEICENEKE